MEAVVVHSGFDGLKFTVQTEISPELREKLASAKEHAKKTFSDCLIEFGPVSEHSVSVKERIAKARGRYRLR